MVRERKCILCHTVYSSKKEMDEHMRSMLHHRELENLKGRDSNHECQVCKVTVMGLSAYAKHISSQLHKDNIEADDAEDGQEEEEEEEEEEEYFDKELIQLIQQRNEQNRIGEMCRANHETESNDRRLQRQQDDRTSYQDRELYDSPSRYHRGPSQRDWNWENEGFLNPRQSKFPHSARKANNMKKHLVSQRGRPGWHPNNSGAPPNWYHNYGNVGAVWHQNVRGGMSGWPHGGRGRSSSWNLRGKNSFSNWQSKNSGANRKPGPQSTNDWNVGRNRSANYSSQMDSTNALWSKSKNIQESYIIERYSWQWQESGSVASYTSLAKENDINSFLDFTSDQLPSDQLLNFVVSEPPESKASKVNGKCNNPSRDKTNRWAPYPSPKIVEQQPASVENVAKPSEKADSAHLSSSPLSPKWADPKTNKSKIKKSEENYPVATNSKTAPSKSAPCKAPIEYSSETNPDCAEGKGSRMPSLKSPLLAIPDTKPSQKRSPKSLLKQVQLLLSSSSRECQNQLNTLKLENSNSSLHGFKASNEHNNNSKGIKQMLGNKKPLNEVLQKTKEEIQYNSSLENSFSGPCRMTQTDGNKDWSAEGPTHKTHESQIVKLENKRHRDVSENKTALSKVYSSSDLAEPEHAAERKGNSVGELGGAGKNDPEFQMDSLESRSSDQQHNGGMDLKAYLEEGGDEDARKSNDALEEDSYGDHSNQELQKDLTGQPAALLPELSKLGFPASLQRDLTWRASLKSKTGSHLPEPNLNSARRIRNVSGHRKSETEKESGLKPTLRQMISVSRRNVNWEQVIQQVTKKKQELGKGLPRFGIEMVPLIQNEQEGLEVDEEADLTSLEGFHWEGVSVGSPGTVRKRSLSESSVTVDKAASAYSFFSNQSTSKENEPKQIGSIASTQDAESRSLIPTEAMVRVKQESASLPSSPFMSERTDSGRRLSLQTPPNVDTIAVFGAGGAQRNPEYSAYLLESHGMLESPGERYAVASALATFSALDAATDSSYTSGNEQNDSQGTGKKRRATGEGSSPEIPSLERKNKRRKIKGKKERSQVDQLLSVSLKEEELSKSLQSVDGSLLKARAALQAAYMEVQRLLVLKQQISVEMGTLRSQRIQILQGLQESYDPSEQPHVLHASDSSEKKDGKLHSAQSLIANPGLLVPLLETASPLAAQMPPVPLAASLQVNSPPTFQTPTSLGAISAPNSCLQIKQEPASPRHGEESMNISEDNSPQAELPFPGGNTSQQPSLYPLITATMSLSGLIDFQEPDQDIQKSLADNGKTRLLAPSPVNGSPLLLPVKSEESKASADNSIPGQCSSSFQSHTFPLELYVSENSRQTVQPPEQRAISTPASTESKRSKKKKKLKKKKALRAAAQVPENSDTEQDVSDSKPFRKVKTIKVPKGEKVTTSTPPKQEDAAQEGKPKKEENESDTSLEFVEVPRSPLEVVAITSSESGDEKPDSPSKREALNASEQLLKEASRSGYDEVSSTSEIGTYRDGVARSVAETQTPISSLRGSKNASEVSSEPGDDEEPTEGVFEGHKASVNAIQIFGNLLYTCSADKTIHAYNLVNRKCVGIFEGHTSKVNCLLVTQTTGKNAALYSGSSDHTINCYNIKTRELVDQFRLDDRVLCLHSRWKILYVGLANGNVVTFNLKNNKQLDAFECHTPRAISCLATAQEGARRLLIVGSYDCTISVRDARNGLLLRTLEGHSKTVLCMKVVNDLVFSGSSDQSVHAHNIHTGELVRIYKGHNHAVTVVNILGKVMVTACLDKCVRVYELQSHDRLQVYGGHTDMIMCMTIHKSMIYTGCYDGSIQAVRLNLMQNYRCWWHGCSLIFGVMDHLKQHLLNDHTNPNFQTLKCRWKNCDAFFTSRKSSKQDAVGHIEKHAEDDSKIDS
ncbi:hypothetical protein JRQ81_000744 [Phrynocephalus forsythii]|uniref:Zinc finger protein 106 n=1 Tax=Phrynocephalus forsythii TaxID=171643 RepID=A0A9Q0Y5V8_9SAUR|nr:hypothetical protein JRQ81_000744 [Phrynocephalus forsythii]